MIFCLNSAGADSVCKKPFTNRSSAASTAWLPYFSISGETLHAHVLVIVGPPTSSSPGASSCNVAFAANHGGPLPEGQIQPGDLVRISAMSCNDKPASAADYSLYFVEGMLPACCVLEWSTALCAAVADLV